MPPSHLVEMLEPCSELTSGARALVARFEAMNLGLMGLARRLGDDGRYPVMDGFRKA